MKKGLSKPTEGKRQPAGEQQCWTFSREGNYKTFPAAQCFQASADPFLVPTWHQLISLLQLIIPWGLAWYSFPLYSKQRWRAEKPLGDSTVLFKSRFCASSPSISFLSPPHRFYNWPAPISTASFHIYFFLVYPSEIRDGLCWQSGRDATLSLPVTSASSQFFFPAPMPENNTANEWSYSGLLVR